MVRDINIEHVLATLPYVLYIPFPVLVPLIFTIIFRRNKFILFHSIQALFIHLVIGTFISISVSIIEGDYSNIMAYLINYKYMGDYVEIICVVFAIIYILTIVVPMLLGAYYASSGKWFKFPIIGFISEKIVSRSSSNVIT